MVHLHGQDVWLRSKDTDIDVDDYVECDGSYFLQFPGTEKKRNFRSGKSHELVSEDESFARKR